MRPIALCMAPRAWLACVVALAGCATTRAQTNVPAAPLRASEERPAEPAERADGRADEPPQERQPAGWPPYYPPRLVRDLAGTDAVSGEAASIERGYVLHRVDLEKVRVLEAQATSCEQALGVCERRVAGMAARPGFWDRTTGRVLLLGLGFVTGVGVSVGIAGAIE